MDAPCVITTRPSFALGPGRGDIVPSLVDLIKASALSYASLSRNDAESSLNVHLEAISPADPCGSHPSVAPPPTSPPAPHVQPTATTAHGPQSPTMAGHTVADIRQRAAPGQVIFVGDMSDDTRLSSDHAVTVQCKRGHLRQTTAQRVDKNCELCVVLDIEMYRNRGIRAVSTSFNDDMHEFEFACEHGHHFTADQKMAKHGCRTCSLLSLTHRTYGLKRDTLLVSEKSLNARDDSILRMKCTTCAKYFMATPTMLRNSGGPSCESVASCRSGHQSPAMGMIEVIAALEDYYDTEFDDHAFAHGVILTGYSAALGIIVIHANDRAASTPANQKAVKQFYRATGGVRFTVPACVTTVDDARQYVRDKIVPEVARVRERRGRSKATPAGHKLQPATLPPRHASRYAGFGIGQKSTQSTHMAGPSGSRWPANRDASDARAQTRWRDARG